MLLLTDSGPLDVLGFIGGGKRYEDVAAAAETVTIGGSSVRIISLEQLIEERKSLGRDKDVAALRLLESLAKRRRGRS
jgi:predicted nucleotidyltransferase